MTKDVLITVSGLRIEGSEQEDIELVTSGKYYNKSGKDYILYEEYIEDIEESTQCNIIIENDKVDIIKHGSDNVHMIFEKFKRKSSYYQTPYGNLLMGFNTTDLKVNKEKDEISIFIKYNIDINNHHVSENDINIKVESKAL